MKSFFRIIIAKILEWESRIILWKYKPRIVAVTGNVGKTSTKDAIYTVLSDTFYVRKSEKSFNSELGVPLTILGCDNGWNNPFVWLRNILSGLGLIFLKNHYPKWLVLEVGADRPGDIEKITKWLHPDIAIITRIGDVPVHVEFFDSKDAVIREKAFLASEMKEGGILVINGDDKNLEQIRSLARGKIITYGFGEEVALRASHEEILYEAGKPIGVGFKVNYGSNTFPVKLLGTVGFHHIQTALASLSVALSLNINLVSAIASLEKHEASKGRLRILSGKEGSIILDDTYNASPLAVEAALDSLELIETKGRKIAVLGDMMELGKFSADEHKKIGEMVKKSADIFIAVGLRMKDAYKIALEKRMSQKKLFSVDSSKEAGVLLSEMVLEGDVVLIKGSQSMRMERAVEAILSPEVNKDKVLVRQDPQWLRRG